MSLADSLRDSRRTFAIISHPDAGKTTITEKVLLFGNALQTAGTVKGKKSGQHAKSDWMEMEKERGISVTTSVMQFPYEDKLVNLLDTPLARQQRQTPPRPRSETLQTEANVPLAVAIEY